MRIEKQSYQIASSNDIKKREVFITENLSFIIEKSIILISG